MGSVCAVRIEPDFLRVATWGRRSPGAGTPLRWWVHDKFHCGGRRAISGAGRTLLAALVELARRGVRLFYCPHVVSLGTGGPLLY